MISRTRKANCGHCKSETRMERRRYTLIDLGSQIDARFSYILAIRDAIRWKDRKAHGRGSSKKYGGNKIKGWVSEDLWDGR